MTDVNCEIHEGSGNIFADLGLPHPEERLAKAVVLMQIRDAIEEQGLTQEQAGRRMRLPQPKVSNLLRGRLEGFSMDRLFRCLNALGRDVEIVITRKPADRERGEVRVRGQAPAPTPAR